MFYGIFCNCLFIISKINYNLQLLVNKNILGQYFLVILRHLCMRAQLCLFVTPMDCSPPGSSVHGIRQARILQWVPIPSFSRSSHPRIKPTVSFISCIACRLFTTEPLGNFFELLFCSEPLASWFVKRKQNSEGFMM